MKSFTLLVICYLPLLLFSQVAIEGPWHIECGASTNTLFKKNPSLNLRYISPRFRWPNEDMTAEQEKHPEKHKGMRLMSELIYTPPLKVLCLGFYAQCYMLKYKIITLEAYGGPKFFLIPGPEFSTTPRLKDGKEAWYINVGVLCQIDLDIIAPFFDFGYDGILTVGAELDIHAIYRNPKKRYKLRKRETKTAA